MPSLRIPGLRVPAWRIPGLRIPRFRIPTLRVPNLWMPKREDRAPSDAPSSGKPSSTPWHAPRATPLVKGVITGFAAIAVVWIGVLVVAPGAGSLASAKLAGLSGAAAHDARAGARSLEAEPASAAPDSTVPAGPGPALAAAPRPKHAPTSATAAAAVPPAARPHPNRSLCSVADEAANLCRLQ
jgi:hypothetical protein